MDENLRKQLTALAALANALTQALERICSSPRTRSARSLAARSAARELRRGMKRVLGPSVPASPAPTEPKPSPSSSQDPSILQCSACQRKLVPELVNGDGLCPLCSGTAVHGSSPSHVPDGGESHAEAADQTGRAEDGAVDDAL